MALIGLYNSYSTRLCHSPIIIRRCLSSFSGAAGITTINQQSLIDNSLNRNNNIKIFNQVQRNYCKISEKNLKMRFIQFQRDDSVTKLGLISEDGKKMVDLSARCPHLKDMIGFLKAGSSGLDKIREKSNEFQWDEINDKIQILSPVTNPEKIVCIGLNYLGHCLEQNKEAPKEPMFFSKFASTIVSPYGNVIHHNITTQLDWEVELAVIIGKEARHVKLEDAMDYVFGYSVAQDISARDWQKSRNGGQFLIGKSMDTFCPLGPAVVHKSEVPDPHQLSITCSINGVQKQNGNTSELIFRIDQIIHLLTQSITLKPGDVILTGTPSGVGMHRNPPEYLKPGDIIESEVQHVGKIKNKVIADF